MMNKSFHAAGVLSCAVVLATGLDWAGPVLAKPPQSNTFTSVNDIGDVSQSKTPNQGKLHVAGGFEARSADYFRGSYDGVSTNISDTELSPFLAVTFELPTFGLAQSLAATVGTFDSFTTDPTRAESQSPVGDAFYESNNYVGLSAGFEHHVVLGVTFTDYTTPDGLFPSSKEVAFSARYAGGWHPQFKAAVPTDSGNGVYTVANIKPALKILKNTGHPVTLGLPLAVAAGFADYYGQNTGTPAFVSAGVSAATSLTGKHSAYGNWALSAGVDVRVRNDDLKNLTPERNDTAVPIGVIKVSFVY